MVEHYKEGVSSLIGSAINDRKDTGFNYLLSGDLNQMGIQDRFLRDQHFNVGRVNVYPALRTQEEFDQALTLIYKRRVPGWWHYEKRLIELGVCTQEEFDVVLGRKR